MATNEKPGNWSVPKKLARTKNWNPWPLWPIGMRSCWDLRSLWDVGNYLYVWLCLGSCLNVRSCLYDLNCLNMRCCLHVKGCSDMRSCFVLSNATLNYFHLLSHFCNVISYVQILKLLYLRPLNFIPSRIYCCKTLPFCDVFFLSISVCVKEWGIGQCDRPTGSAVHGWVDKRLW